MKENKVNRTSLRKDLTGIEGKILMAIGIVWMLFQILVASQIVIMTPHKLRIVHLGFALAMVFLATPFTKKSNSQRFSFVDILLVAATAVVFIGSFARYNTLMRMAGRCETIDVVLSVFTILLMYEGARRVSSRGLIWLSLIVFAYIFLGPYIPGALRTNRFSLTRIMNHIVLGGEGVYGFALGVSAETIVIFVIFGALLQEVGIADYFYDLSNTIAGNSKGGPAKVAVLSSSLMGMVSGETSANVATTGAFTIPLMKKVGYDNDFAGAVECAASAGGQILPPVMGATAFMLADTLGIPYIKLALAAILPAILYYISVFFTVHFRAVRFGMTGSGVDKKDWIDLLKRSYLMLPLVFIVVLLVIGYTPTFSAFWGGIISAIVLSFFRKETRITPRKLIKVLYQAARTAMTLGIATAVVGIIVGTFSLTGITMTLARLIFNLAGGIKFLTLLLTAVVAIILGMGLPTSAAYVLASISAAPALTMLGIDLLPAHLFVFYYGCMSTITPPVATGAYTAAGLSGGDPNRTGFQSIKLAIAGFVVPFIFIYSQDLLMKTGSNKLMGLFSLAVTGFGLIFLAAFFEKAFFRAVSTPMRIIFLALAVLLIMPSVPVSIVGAVLGIAVIVYLRISDRKKPMNVTA
ncbi:MAG: TRAP transporter permease [Candidatus Ornithospirochaeta sp.]|nr:TRAP transporter permease [Candidatus Ornithospirochaeta sp.]